VSLLRATFPKTTRGDNLAEYACADDLTASSPSNGRPGRLPHDLDHYIIESQVDVPYGFWALAARQAPFASFTIARGRWPRGKVEWFERVQRKHRGEMIQSEAVAGIVTRIACGDLDIDRDWSAIRRWLTRAYTYESRGAFASLTQRDLTALVPFHDELHRTWDAIPVGGALRVSFPKTGDSVVIDSYQDTSIVRGRRRQRQTSPSPAQTRTPRRHR
jgi:hypothetical protein